MSSYRLSGHAETRIIATGVGAGRPANAVARLSASPVTTNFTGSYKQNKALIPKPAPPPPIHPSN